jgi:hypothetical protein
MPNPYGIVPNKFKYHPAVSMMSFVKILSGKR